MRKNLFILLIVLTALLVVNGYVSAQETANFTPGPVVREEQKLMVTIQLEIAEGNAVHVKNQYGFALYPQTVITALDPMLVFGARATVIYQNKKISAIRANFNLRLGLATLLLIEPLAINTQKTNLFSEKDFGENTFILTPHSITNIKDLTKKDSEENRLRGAVAVDDQGTLFGIVSSIEKNIDGTLTPSMIPFDYVGAFIEFLKQDPPIPQFSPPENSEPETNTDGKSVNLNTI